MISQAKLNYLKISPRKVRLVANLIRGKKLEEAQNLLRFTLKRGTLPLLKLLNQAVANAVSNNAIVNEKNLFISKIFIDEGPVAKRRFPRARGKSDIIRKRTSHVTIELDEITKEVKDVTKDRKTKTVKNEAQSKKTELVKKVVKKELKEEKKIENEEETVSKKVKPVLKKETVEKNK